MSDLFGNPLDNPIIPDGPAMTPRERKRMQRRLAERPKGYFASPGTGPAGETCKSCEHATNIHYHDKSYWKCKLAEYRWAHSIQTDIRISSPACKGWEPAE